MKHLKTLEMKIFNYNEFLTENIDNLTYPIFDWDDNILHMETKIYVKRNVNGGWEDDEISTTEFARMKEKYEKYHDNEEFKLDFSKAFLDFRDFGPKGDSVFLNDVKFSISEKLYGPSWNKFIESIVNGNLFGIVTTRGHEPKSIRSAVEYIIFNELNDDQQDKMLNNLMKYHELFDKDFDFLVEDYLDKCFYIGVMSKHFRDTFGYDPTKDLNEGKQRAVAYLINEFNEYGEDSKLPVKIGFSDDDKSYSTAIKKTFIKNKELFDNIDFYVFDTSDPNLDNGIKEKI